MIPPVTIESVESFFPDREVPIEDLSERLGLTPPQLRVLKRLHGLDRIRFDPELGLFDLLLPAARKLVERVNDAGRIRYVIYVHASQEVTPSGTDAAAVIAESLGLGSAQAFAMTQQNCAQVMTAIDLAGDLLRYDGDLDGLALIVVGEQAFSPMIQVCYPMGQLLGEGAGACLVAIRRDRKSVV